MNSFTSVNRSRVDAPVLALPDPDNSLSFAYDASNFAIGVVLYVFRRRQNWPCHSVSVQGCK